MIIRWYEVSCDQCGNAEHFRGSKDSAKTQAIKIGWLSVGKFMFCTTTCKTDYKKHSKTSTTNK